MRKKPFTQKMAAGVAITLASIVALALFSYASAIASPAAQIQSCFQIFLPIVTDGGQQGIPGNTGDNRTGCQILFANATATALASEIVETPEPSATAIDTSTPVPATPTATVTRTPTSTTEPTPTSTVAATPSSTPVSMFSGVDAYCDANESEAHFDYEISRNAFHLVQARRNGELVFSSGRSSFTLVEIAGEYGDVIEFTINYLDSQVALESVTMDCLAPPATGVAPTATPSPTATPIPVDLSQFWSQQPQCMTESQGYSFSPAADNMILALSYTGSVDPLVGVEGSYSFSVYDDLDVLQWTHGGSFTVYDGAQFFIPLDGKEGWRVDWLVEQYSDDSASWVGVLNGTSGEINCIPEVLDVEFYCDASNALPITTGYTVTMDGAFALNHVGEYMSYPTTGWSQVLTDTSSSEVFQVGPFESGHPLEVTRFELSHKGVSLGHNGYDYAACYQDYTAEIAMIDGGNNRNGYGVVVTGTQVISTVSEAHHFEVVSESDGPIAYDTDTLVPTETLSLLGLVDGDVVTMTIYSDVDNRVIDQVTQVVSMPDTLTCTNDMGAAPAPVDTVYWDTSRNPISGTLSTSFRRQGSITTTVPYSATRGLVAVCYPAIPSEEPTVGIAWFNPEPDTLGPLEPADWASTVITLTPGMQWVEYDGMGAWDAQSGPDVPGVVMGVGADFFTSLSIGFFDGEVNDPEIAYGPDTDTGEFVHVAGTDIVGRIEGVSANPSTLWGISDICHSDGSDVELEIAISYYGALGGTADVYSSYAAVIDRKTTIGMGGNVFTHTEIYPLSTTGVTWRIEQDGQVVGSGTCVLAP